MEESPRPYDLIVFFTSEGCTLCQDLMNEYAMVSAMYTASNGQYAKNKNRPVFFATLSYSGPTHKIFLEHGFTSVPNIVYYPQRLLKLKKESRVLHMKTFVWEISGNDGHITHSKVLEWVNQKSRRQVVYKESIVRLLLVLALLAYLGYKAGSIMYNYHAWFNDTRLWLVVSILVYVICMAGMVSNLIHNTAYTKTDNQGNVVWY